MIASLSFLHLLVTFFKSKRGKDLALQNILCIFAPVYITKTDKTIIITN